MLWHEQCSGGQNDQRRRRPKNSRTKVLLPTLGRREGRYPPRNGRGRENEGKKEERKGPSSPSAQAQLVRKSAPLNRGHAHLSDIRQRLCFRPKTVLN